MALGTNYKRQGDKFDKRVVKNLDEHHVIMERLIDEGWSREAASKKAYRIVCGYE